MFSAAKSGNMRLSHVEHYSVMAKDKIECAFPNVETSLRMFFTLMVPNCSAERSFFKLKHIKNPNRTTMRQEYTRYGKKR